MRNLTSQQKIGFSSPLLRFLAPGQLNCLFVYFKHMIPIIIKLFKRAPANVTIETRYFIVYFHMFNEMALP